MVQVINKTALVEELMLHDYCADNSKAATTRFVEDFFDKIMQHVADGNDVSIANFGKFEPFERQNGQFVPKFRPFTHFKNLVANAE